MSTEQSFECVACAEDYSRETAVKECRICHRTSCVECISEEGICVPCSK
jgi:hypothetical protein